jgi:hypothetical protein
MHLSDSFPTNRTIDEISVRKQLDMSHCFVGYSRDRVWLKRSTASCSRLVRNPPSCIYCILSRLLCLSFIFLLLLMDPRPPTPIRDVITRADSALPSGQHQAAMYKFDGSDESRLTPHIPTFLDKQECEGIAYNHDRIIELFDEALSLQWPERDSSSRQPIMTSIQQQALLCTSSAISRSMSNISDCSSKRRKLSPRL